MTIVSVGDEWWLVTDGAGGLRLQFANAENVLQTFGTSMSSGFDDLVAHSDELFINVSEYDFGVLEAMFNSSNSLYYLAAEVYSAPVEAASLFTDIELAGEALLEFLAV